MCGINSELLKFGISIACDAELNWQLKCGFNVMYAGQVELWRVNYYAYPTAEWRSEWKIKHWMVELRNVKSTFMSKGCGRSWHTFAFLFPSLLLAAQFLCQNLNLLSCIHVFGEQHHTNCFQDPKLDGNLDHFKGWFQNFCTITPFLTLSSTNHAQMSIKLTSYYS